MKIVAAAAIAALALALAGGASAGQTYTDSVGEVAGSVDISTVAVSNDPEAQTVTFAVTTNLPALDANTFIAIPVDSDMNVATGQGGFDYIVAVTTDGSAVLNPTSGGVLPEQGSYTNGVWAVTVPAADIGNPLSFRFGVVSETGPDPNNPVEDVAPDTGVWLYAMDQGPPPPPAPKPVIPQVSSVSVTYAGVPKAGKTFKISSLAVHLSTGVDTKATKLHCSATLGGKHLAGSGTAGCTFRLPATAKGKKLVIKVTGKYRTVSLARTQRFTVR
jgi:hypothetical protein